MVTLKLASSGITGFKCADEDGDRRASATRSIEVRTRNSVVALLPATMDQEVKFLVDKRRLIVVLL
jgi:hypothetical protein